MIDEIFNIADREKRNYVWLSFLKNAEEQFRKMQLSPGYKQIKNAQNEIAQAIDEITRLKELHKSLKGFDLQNHKALFKSKIFQEDIDLWLEDLQESFLPASIKKVKEFDQLKDFVYSITDISPVGIEQLYNKEGYVFIKYREEADTQVYQYKISTYTNAAERRKVYLQPLMTVKESIHFSFHTLKKELNRKHNPIMLNGYLLECSVKVPFETTLVPIAKGKLCRYLKSA
ncbi:hypothetical protein GYB22_10060 [bacterium]|nr:hypothetical protein [bacterium]